MLHLLTGLRWLGSLFLWLVILALLAAVVVPAFLDRRYYDGPVSGHYDGARFFNPDGEDTHSTPAGRSRGAFLLTQATGNDGRPSWPARVPISTDRPPERVTGQAMRVTWVGHATVLIQTAGINILTDPIWSDRAGPLGFGPRRVTQPGIRFHDLPPIDLVLVSHNHYDHLDLATLGRLWERDAPLIVTSLGNDSVIGQAGVKAVALDWGGVQQVRPGITVHVTRNHHWSSRWFTDRNRALWSSFVVRLPSGGNLFFAGDTGAGDYAWADEARQHGPIRLALLPIGAFRFEPGQMATGSHIGPIDAALIFRRLGASWGIAVHWGTFRLSYEARDTPPRLLRAANLCLGDVFGQFDRRFIAPPPGRGLAVPVARTFDPPPQVITLPPPTRADLLRCLDTAAVRALR